MNAESILIEIRCPGVNHADDCVVSRSMTVRDLCRQYLELLSETAGISFGNYPEAVLMSQRLGCALSPDLTLDQQGVDSGDTLFLI